MISFKPNYSNVAGISNIAKQRNFILFNSYKIQVIIMSKITNEQKLQRI